MCKRIKIYWQSCHKRFTLTCSHLGNFSFVQYNPTKKLHIVVYHIPHYFCTSCFPAVFINCFIAFYTNKIVFRSQIFIKLSSCYYSFLILGKSACCIFHNSESFWQHLFKYNLKFVGDFFFNFINLFPNYFTLFEINIFYSFFQLIYLVFLFRNIVVNAFFHFF